MSDVRSHVGIYERIGGGYASHRQPDPRIAAHIHAALGDARRVCNVGAGSGSYEPTDRRVVAVEPSPTMIRQRPGDTPIVRGQAEALPFADDSFDAVMGVLTVHHWENLFAGLAEMRRVAPLRVLFVFDPERQVDFWLVRDYLPEIQDLELDRAPRIAELVDGLGGAEVAPVPIPHDCTDGFQAAYWRRPERYLDPQVRASISTLAQLPEARVTAAIEQLRRDLADGTWEARHGWLRGQASMDYAYRLVVSRERR